MSLPMSFTRLTIFDSFKAELDTSLLASTADDIDELEVLVLHSGSGVLDEDLLRHCKAILHVREHSLTISGWLHLVKVSASRTYSGTW